MNTVLAGFKPHRVGRVHLLCPGCGRKQSNMPSHESDPPGTVLVRVFCPRCSEGGKCSDQDYVNIKGETLDGYEWTVKGRLVWRAEPEVADATL